MDDEGGGDAKLLAVPTDKLYPLYRNVKSPEDLQPEELERIKHFSSTTKTSKKVNGSRSRAGTVSKLPRKSW